VSSATRATEDTGPAPVPWHVATVAEVRPETVQARTLALELPTWPGHVAGQHVDVRLTAEDGYHAQRSYSIASPPGAERVELTVERLADGEVSPYLTDDVVPGDVLDVRGPLGGYFTWRPEDGGPLLLVAGGSGLVPLMAMLRERRARAPDLPARTLVSARTPADLLFATELEFEDALVTYTRAAPAGWTGPTRRLDAELLAGLGAPRDARAFVCGPTGFVEAAATLLLSLGHAPERVRTERFGPSGG
jgi:ferredoxin-NADP reductase